MQRDKKLAYRILKVHYDASWESDTKRVIKLWDHHEFSDLDEDGKKAFYYRFHMLGYLGCFLDYRFKSENGIVKEPVLGLLSWFGHDFLRQLAVELGEEEVH